MSRGKSEGKEFKSWLHAQRRTLPPGAIRYVLEALIPYTEANLKLTFKPSEFFRDIDKRESKRKYAIGSLRRAYNEAKQRGMIIDDNGWPKLSDEAMLALEPYEPEELAGSHIMVIFDIPEEERNKRQWLRLLLRELKFTKVQQSVWMTNYECRDVLEAGIREKHLQGYVQVFESRRI